MGTEKETFVELVERIGTTTGGLSFSTLISDKKGQKEPIAYFMIKGKAMADKAGSMLDLMLDVLVGAKLDDQTRFKQMALETKSGLEASTPGLNFIADESN